MIENLRKTVTFAETVLIEGGRAAEVPLQTFVAAAVLKNPWIGEGFVEDLRPKISEFASPMGETLTAMILEMAGSGEAVEAYGKAATVGTMGEVEHGSALIHTLHFGNHYRNAVDAKSYLAFTNTRGPANGAMMVPLMDKNDAGRRSHYLTLQFAIPDAPAPDEIVVALGAASGGRPHHRIGDRYKDLEELGHDGDNPAAV